MTIFASKFPEAKDYEKNCGIEIVRRGGRYSVYLAAQQFYKNLSDRSFDIIIDQINTRPFFVPSFRKGHERVVALIFQLAREYWWSETPFPMNLIGYFILERHWLRKYRTVPTVTISQSTCDDLHSMGFSKVHVVQPGVGFTPLSHIPKKSDHPILVYDGRLKKAKRPDHALKAFLKLRRTVRDAELWIIGDGYMRNSFTNLDNLGVRVFPDVDKRKRMDLLEKSWILINPSVREGFGLNVLNANALGTPVVGYDVPGLRDSVRNRDTGLLVPSGDIRSLTEALRELVLNRDLRERMSKNALEFSRTFSWDRTSERFLEILSAS